MKNDYELGVMNGAMGIVLDTAADGSLTIDFDGHPVEISGDSGAPGNLQLAYATSIHKVQGSEFPCAIVIAHKSHSFMHHRNLLYTAVTRAKDAVIILGDRWGIDNCASKCQWTGVTRSSRSCCRARRARDRAPGGCSHLLPPNHRRGHR